MVTYDEKLTDPDENVSEAITDPHSPSNSKNAEITASSLLGVR